MKNLEKTGGSLHRLVGTTIQDAENGSRHSILTVKNFKEETLQAVFEASTFPSEIKGAKIRKLEVIQGRLILALENQASEFVQVTFDECPVSIRDKF